MVKAVWNGVTIDERLPVERHRELSQHRRRRRDERKRSLVLPRAESSRCRDQGPDRLLEGRAGRLTFWLGQGTLAKWQCS